MRSAQAAGHVRSSDAVSPYLLQARAHVSHLAKLTVRPMRETLYKLTHLLDGYLIEIVDKQRLLVHLGDKEVRRCIQRLEKWRLKGQKIETPGRLLMHLLNEKARAATGFNINDLGTEPGGVVA